MQARVTGALAALLVAALATQPAAAFGPDATAAGAFFRFAVLCDVHVTAADLTGSRATLRRAVDEINSFASQLDFVLVAGDLAESPLPTELGLELLVAKEELDRLALPYHLALGNHDVTATGDDTAFRALFGATTYRFAHRGVQFMSFRTPVDRDATYLASAALDSLSRWLGEIAPTDPLIVFAHHPLGPVTPYGVTNKQSFYDRVDPYNLKAVFNGHYHGLFEEERRGAWYCTSRALSLHRANHDGETIKGYRLATVWPDFTVSSSFYPLGEPPTFAPAPPVFAATGSRYAVVGRSLRVALAARDESGETIRYAAQNLPAGASFDPVQATFTWTPAAGQAGWVPGIRFLASNGAGSDTLDLAVRVLASACAYDDFGTGFGGWTTAGGSWAVQNGSLLQTSTAGGPYACTAAGSFSDLYLEADLVHDAGVGYAGLVFRYQDLGNFYYLWNDGGQIELRRRAGGVASRLGEPIAVGAVSGWHHVRIEARGANLKVYWDGSLRFEADDATFSSGQVGFVCSQASARFDNFVATGCAGLPGSAPVLAAVGDRTVFVGAECEFVLQAADADLNPLQFTSADLPPGATLNPATGRFNWTPPPSAAWTTRRSTLRVTDGELDDAERITWTVLDTAQSCAYSGFDPGTELAAWLPSAGTWTVAGGVYTGTATSPTWSRFGSSARRDYTLQARVRVEGNGSGNLVFRATDATHYYYLYASSTAGELELRKLSGSTVTTLARGGDIAGAVRDRWHTYRVEVLGSRIRVWADGEPRFEVLDQNAPYLQGAVGLRCENATLRADDVVVYGCSDAPTDVPPQAAAILLGTRCIPNPFNPSTTLELELGAEAHTRAILYGPDGRRIRALVNAQLRCGPASHPLGRTGRGRQQCGKRRLLPARRGRWHGGDREARTHSLIPAASLRKRCAPPRGGARRAFRAVQRMNVKACWWSPGPPADDTLTTAPRCCRSVRFAALRWTLCACPALAEVV